MNLSNDLMFNVLIHCLPHNINSPVIALIINMLSLYTSTSLHFNNNALLEITENRTQLCWISNTKGRRIYFYVNCLW